MVPSPGNIRSRGGKSVVLPQLGLVPTRPFRGAEVHAVVTGGQVPGRICRSSCAIGVARAPLERGEIGSPDWTAAVLRSLPPDARNGDFAVWPSQRHRGARCRRPERRSRRCLALRPAADGRLRQPRPSHRPARSGEGHHHRPHLPRARDQPPRAHSHPWRTEFLARFDRPEVSRTGRPNASISRSRTSSGQPAATASSTTTGCDYFSITVFPGLPGVSGWGRHGQGQPDQ